MSLRAAGRFLSAAAADEDGTAAEVPVTALQGVPPAVAAYMISQFVEVRQNPSLDGSSKRG
jgi:hypothetical protein